VILIANGLVNNWLISSKHFTNTQLFVIIVTRTKGTEQNKMKNVAKFEKDGFGAYQVIDSRSGNIVKRNIAKASKAAAYVQYYNEEIEKAEKQWEQK
tara:strand:- start:917 stop:1207 length:291 start_codon:yes stop_codon:yes gene_type:complete